MLLLLWLACTGTKDTSEGAPSAVIVSPEDGASVCGPTITVETQVENFTLVPEGTSDPGPSDGHLHVYLNGQYVLQPLEETFTLEGLDTTSYQLRIELALASHAVLDPFVGDVVFVNVLDCGGE